MTSPADIYDSESLTSSLSTEAEHAPDAPKNLLTMDEPEAAKALFKLWEDQDTVMQRKLAGWEVNDLRRQGFTQVRLVRNQDNARWSAWPPASMRVRPVVEMFNKARILCRVFTGNMHADPYAPSVEPTRDDADARDTSETTERALEDIQSPNRLNTAAKMRRATDRACTYGSGFISYRVDPMGRGRRPMSLQASPLAAHADHPLIDPATGLPHAPMMPDPLNLPVIGDDGMVGPEDQTTMVPAGPAPDPIQRYVTADRTLTDDIGQAAYEWVPDLKSEVLDGRHVRLIPHTASSVAEAHGVLIATYITLGQAKRMFPDLGPMDEDARAKLVTFQPEGTDMLMPPGSKKRQMKGDEQLVFCLTGVFTGCPDYPEGAYLIALGDQRVPYRDTWDETVKGKREALPLPVAQVKLFDNGQADPYGDGLMDDLGGANELRAAQIGHAMQYLDKWNNMPVFLPSISPLNESDLYGGKRIARFMPGQKPESLQAPGMDPVSMELFQLASTEMDSASHMQQAAQGVEDPSVQSGRHAYQIIQQVHAQLSEPKQNQDLGYLQCCNIELRLTRAFNLDGETRWQGEDGEYKYTAWQGADLDGEVRIKPGSGTLLSPAHKADVITGLMEQQMLPADQAQDMIANGIGATLGRWDNPFLLEVRRSLAKWKDAIAEAPEGAMGAPAPMMPPVAPPPMGAPMGQPMDPAQQQAMAQAQAMMQQQVMLSAAAQFFPPAPHHTLPNVAKLRLTEIAKVMATSKYAGADPMHRMALDGEFLRMEQAAAPPPPMPQGVGADGKPIDNHPATPANPGLDPHGAAA